MAALAKAIVVFSVMALIDICFGTVYKVGDSLGWTNETKNVDYYKDWASNKTFYVGDSFYFEYDNKQNDVMEVSREDFHACNPKVPLNIYSSGRDNITMRKKDHVFYICTMKGHCQAGQKVDIRVLGPPPPTATPTPPPPSPSSTSPTPSSPSPSSTSPTPPSPSPSSSTPPTPGQPLHFSPPVGAAPGPSKDSADQPSNSPQPMAAPPGSSKNSAPSFLSSKCLQLLMALGFLAYDF